MATISRSNFKEKQTVSKNPNRLSLWGRYMEYAKGQSDAKVLWYFIVILTIPCFFMVIAVGAMMMITPNFVWFVALNMLLFYGNVLAHIAETKSTFYVPLYHGTVVILMFIPFITYLLS